MIDTFFSNIETEQIFPLDKITEVYKEHEPPQIRRYLDKEIKNIDLEAYNIAIFNKAHISSKKEDIKRIVSGKDLREVFENFNLDKELDIKISQGLYLDSNYSRDAILLHLAKIKENEVFLEDIVLANIFGDRHKRKLLPGQRYPGIGNGIFDTVLSNIYSLLKNRGITTISCHAARIEQVGIFQKKGFALDLREMDLINLAMQTESQFPMYKEI